MEKQNITTGFQNVDHSQHQFLIKFLEDVASSPSVMEGFSSQLDWLDIKKGNHVLDVGCGIGVQAQAMAELAGTEGRVVGTDLSTVMVEIAQSRTASSIVPLEFYAADALAQPFADQSFDRIRTERVLMYIKDTEAVLKEFIRLLKPGGKALIFDFDWDAFVIAHKDKALTRKIIRYVSDSFPCGRVGPELFRKMKAAGFKNVRIKPSSYFGGGVLIDITKRICEGILETGIANNIFSRTEIEDWWTALDNDAKEDNLFVSYPGFIVIGTNE